MASIAWNSEASQVDKVKDDTWCYHHLHQTPNDCVFKFKFGNKTYGLTSTVSSDVSDDRKIASEIGLFRKYR